MHKQTRDSQTTVQTVEAQLGGGGVRVKFETATFEIERRRYQRHIKKNYDLIEKLRAENEALKCRCGEIWRAFGHPVSLAESYGFKRSFVKWGKILECLRPSLLPTCFKLFVSEFQDGIFRLSSGETFQMNLPLSALDKFLMKILTEDGSHSNFEAMAALINGLSNLDERVISTHEKDQLRSSIGKTFLMAWGLNEQNDITVENKKAKDFIECLIEYERSGYLAAELVSRLLASLSANIVSRCDTLDASVIETILADELFLKFKSVVSFMQKCLQKLPIWFQKCPPKDGSGLIELASNIHRTSESCSVFAPLFPDIGIEGRRCEVILMSSLQKIKND